MEIKFRIDRKNEKWYQVTPYGVVEFKSLEEAIQHAHTNNKKTRNIHSL